MLPLLFTACASLRLALAIFMTRRETLASGSEFFRPRLLQQGLIVSSYVSAPEKPSPNKLLSVR
jgi:hypothetical protein